MQKLALARGWWLGLALAVLGGSAAPAADCSELFSEPVWITPEGFEYLSAHVVDLDGDGDADLVSDGWYPELGVAWIENRGRASVWVAQKLRGVAQAIDFELSGVLDVDEDGDPDLLGSGYLNGSNGVVLENPGDPRGTWKPRIQPSLCTLAWQSGDLDLDGRVDLVPRFVSQFWCENEPAGFAWRIHQIAPYPSGTLFRVDESETPSDVDADGDADLLVWSALGDLDLGTSWLENPRAAAGPWDAHEILPASTQPVHPWRRAVDLDRDGDIDLLSSGADRMLWLEHGEDSWAAQELPMGGSEWPWAIEDLDEDGDADLLTTTGGPSDPPSAAARLRWWRNGSGDGSSWSVCELRGDEEARVVQARVVDLDRDGDLDLVGVRAVEKNAYWDDFRVFWRRNLTPRRPAVFERRSFGSPMSGATAIALADLDRDADVDVVVGSLSGRVVWMENDGGASSWAVRPIAELGTKITALAASDVDRDGGIDVVAAAEGSIRLLRSTGGLAAWTVRTLATDVHAVRQISTGDLIPGGADEVVAALHDAATVLAFRRHGGVWERRVLAGGQQGVSSIAAADLDRDRDLDLVVGAADAQRISWLENAGWNGAWRARPIDDRAGRVHGIVTGDVDRDGRVDLAAARASGAVHWYQQVDSGAGLEFVRREVGGESSAAARLTGAVDLDDDGDLDLLAAAENGAWFAWYVNDASPAIGRWTARPVSSVSGPVKSALAADLDRDGDLDVVAVSERGAIAWFSGVGGSAQPAAPEAVPDAR